MSSSHLRFPPLLWFALLILVAGLVLFSQTWAWHGDEGFHLLASQLINSGKTPYLDFFYPQTPIWAYVDAGWMQIFGDTWRSAHTFSALLTGGSLILSAGFVFERIPESKWRLSAALIAAILIGLNTIVIGFGTIGQAYGICLFLIVAAFRLAIKGVAGTRASLLLGSGLCAGASAGSSLLSAPVLPVLLAWIAYRSVSRDRVKACSWFLAGAGISFLPLVWLALLAPRQTIFNMFEFHLFYRTRSNLAALHHNLNVLTDLLNSGQFLLLTVFAGIGLLFVLGRSQWDAERKAEFYLCGWLTAGLGIFLATARGTFPQYFVILVPFLGILASVGIVATASWLHAPERPAWLIPGVLALFIAGLPWWLWHEYRHPHWFQLDEVARALNRITSDSDDGWVWAGEAIYFAARRRPPSGLEHSDAQKLQLPPDESAKLHVVSHADLKDWVAAGRFATVVFCWAGDDWLNATRVRNIYGERTTVNGCDIFWSKASH